MSKKNKIKINTNDLLYLFVGFDMMSNGNQIPSQILSDVGTAFENVREKLIQEDKLKPKEDGDGLTLVEE